ncbi:MAG: sulfotransferase [Gemmataceae bacterium]|nr:sulfotransferase [Gemmata sp.]MDW8198608.1 sulfotransferase [Gemmataceae bacterium]
MTDAIIIVSGLPRSGTSLMMQLLAAGGIPTLTDHIRTPDPDNPRGYYEFERVKKVKTDRTWLPDARGKAVKMVSQLLFDLPTDENYRVLFMERDLDEVLISQEKMLARLGRPAANRHELKQAFLWHLNRVHKWLLEQPNFAVLRVAYADLVTHPTEQIARVNAFLGERLDEQQAAAAVDPTLYRNRKTREET